MPENSNFNEPFVVTVADCMLRDVEKDMIVLKSKTLLNSNVSFSVEETEIRGGKFHRLLYTYNHSKTGEITLEDAAWKLESLAINSGAEFQKQLTDVYVFEERVVLDETGKGTVKNKTPISGSSAYVQVDNRTIITKNFTGSNFDMGAAYANKEVYVTYKYNDTVDVLTIEGEKFPKSYELTMEFEIYDAKYGIREKVLLIFPAFKPSGNFEIGFASDTPSTSSMNGKVLDSNGVYGSVKVIPVAEADISYTSIAADTGLIELSSDEEYTLTVYGTRSGMYGNVALNNSNLEFESSNESVATVDSAGLVEYVGDGTAYITIIHPETGFVDTVQVDCGDV